MGSSPRSRSCPSGSRTTCEGRRRPDRDRPDSPRARSLSPLPRALLHRGRARVLRVAPESSPELRGQVRRKGGGGQSARLRRRTRFRVAGHRDCGPAETVRAAHGTAGRLGGAHGRGSDRPLDDALARARECGRRRRGGVAPVFQPLYTADEMRAAEQGHDVDALMERAGRAVADAVLRRYPDARRISGVCGKGANGGDGKIALRILREAGLETSEELGNGADVVLDALFGTGFQSEPRPEAAAQIEQINAAGAPVVAVDLPSRGDASTGGIAGGAGGAHPT